MQVLDTLTNKKVVIKAKKVVNAAGPWVDDVKGIEGSKSKG